MDWVSIAVYLTTLANGALNVEDDCKHNNGKIMSLDWFNDLKEIRLESFSLQRVSVSPMLINAAVNFLSQCTNYYDDYTTINNYFTNGDYANAGSFSGGEGVNDFYQAYKQLWTIYCYYQGNTVCNY